MVFLDFLRRRQQHRSRSRSKKARPPTTPPTIAPTLVLLLLVDVLAPVVEVSGSTVLVTTTTVPSLRVDVDVDREACVADSDASAADDFEASDALEAEMEASMTNCGSSSMVVIAVAVPHLNCERCGSPVQR